MLKADRVRELLNYNPETGMFTKASTDESIGRVGWKGYVYIDVDGKPYRAHQLAWLYVHGRWPEKLIDHKDGDKENNRISNLRNATNRQNRFNDKGHTRKHDLPRGVRKNSKNGRFRAENQDQWQVEKSRNIRHTRGRKRVLPACG